MGCASLTPIRYTVLLAVLVGVICKLSTHKLPKVVYLSVGSFPLTVTVLKGALFRGDHDSHMRVYVYLGWLTVGYRDFWIKESFDTTLNPEF